MAAELGCDSYEVINVAAMTEGRKVKPRIICEARWYLFLNIDYSDSDVAKTAEEVSVVKGLWWGYLASANKL